MPIINNASIWFAKLDPKRPNNKFNKTNPTWECQIRTESKEVKKEEKKKPQMTLKEKRAAKAEKKKA